MKISTRFSCVKDSLILQLAFILIIFTQLSFGQTISPTNGSTNCGNCAPPGWFDLGGTPDVSDANTVAAAPAGAWSEDRAGWHGPIRGSGPSCRRPHRRPSR